MAMFISELKFSILGILVHILYLFSMFYIYFKSPILQGLPSVSVSYDAPARRLVLISVDGLQAEKAFHRKYAERTAFFRSIIMNNGSWGVSHTRVPTETRVGHVSIFAGTYEDVSAITNGWKSNPVRFDSVINQSSTAWYWGDEDVINIFNHRSNNIKAYSYGTEELNYDFADKDFSKLDNWVFERVEKFFVEARSSEKLNEQLHKPKLLFFLHLNGIDTIGHSMRPDSMVALENVLLVDRGIKNMTRLFDSFYNNDGLTTYIVTSDHGMTPWGTHGAGEPLETETPFIAWGAGIKKANYKRNINKDLQSAVWGLEDYERHDMEQIDLAPLMAFLIGCSIPVNSVGQLPSRVLDLRDSQKAYGMLSNAKQIYEQYKAHEQNIIDTSFTFQRYSHIEETHGEERIKKIAELIDNKQFLLAIEESNVYISHALKGIAYYQNYNRLYLSLAVNTGFLLWMMIVAVKLLKHHTQLLSVAKQQGYLSKVLLSKPFSFLYFSVVIATAMCLCHLQKTYFFLLFTLFPLLLFKYFLNEVCVLNIRSSINVAQVSTFAVQLMFTILGVELIVLSFFKRGTLSLIGIVLSSLPWVKVLSTTSTTPLTTRQKVICVLWSSCALLICIFPQFPVVTREENYLLVLLAGFISTTIALVYIFLMKSPHSHVIALLTAFMFLSIVVKLHTVLSIHEGVGLPIPNQIFSWLLLIGLPSIPFLVKASSIERLLSMCMALFTIYILTSISYEALFLLDLILLLTAWIFMELFVLNDYKQTHSNVASEKWLTIDHLRISFIFLYFLFLSFFGTGNIASLNSFDIPSIYCFQTVLNKTVQGFIFAVKLFIPFGVVTFFFRSLQSLIDVPIRGLMLVVLLMTDLMALNFFFLIKDEGSWLDIGQSVGHFIITLLFIVVFVPIYELSYFVSGNLKLEEIKPHTL